MRDRKLVVAGLCTRGGRVLITQRRADQPLPLQWEFPGGKIEPGESVEAALVREIREELGVEAHTGDVMLVHRHRYAHGLEGELTVVACWLGGVVFTPSAAVHAWRWVRPADVDLGTILEADRDFVRSLAGAH